MSCCSGSSFTPAPDAALDPEKRVNFTFGMVLGVDDFRQEHAYLAGRDERALRESIGYGVLSGLHVQTEPAAPAISDKYTVRVEPGLALLPNGKLVGVPVDQCASLTEWLAGWKAKGWKTAAKQPVKTVDLWQRLDALVNGAGHEIEWVWVRGHNGDPGNEHADMLANRGVEQALRGGR